MHSLNYTLTRRQTLPIYSVMTLYAASAPVAVTSIVQHLIPIPGSVLLTFLALALFLVALFTERQPVSITELNRIGFLCVAPLRYQLLLRSLVSPLPWSPFNLSNIQRT